MIQLLHRYLYKYVVQIWFQALVLAPTRELAQQIEAAAREYGRLLGIRSLSIFGGASKNGQARGLSNSKRSYTSVLIKAFAIYI